MGVGRRKMTTRDMLTITVSDPQTTVSTTSTNVDRIITLDVIRPRPQRVNGAN